MHEHLRLAGQNQRPAVPLAAGVEMEVLEFARSPVKGRRHRAAARHQEQILRRRQRPWGATPANDKALCGCKMYCEPVRSFTQTGLPLSASRA